MKTNSSLRIFVTLVCYAIVTACTGGGDAVPDGSDSGSNGDTGLTESDFYVSVANVDAISSHMRTAGSFSTNCSIPSTGMSQDLVCIVDVPEGDLSFNGVEFNYNTPSGMCNYLTRHTYWYYNQEFGEGPTAVRIEKEINADGDVTSYQCGINGGAVGSCSGLTEVQIDTRSDTPTCRYDLRTADRENCCLGDYSLTVQTTNTDNGDVTTASSDRTWGGDVKKCIGGAGRTDWAQYSKEGYPVGEIVAASSGVSGKYKITAPINSTNDIWNISIANYFTPALHTHDGYVSATASTLPYFIDPIDDRDGTAIYPGNPSYTFSCLDRAYEIKNRISVYIREWDVYTDYLAYITSGGVTSVPDRPGEDEPADCDGVDGVCNDRWDLDDFVVEYLGGPYDTATPADRRYNFPYQEY